MLQTTDPVRRATAVVAGPAAKAARDVVRAASGAAGRAVGTATDAAVAGTVEAPVAAARGRTATLVALGGLAGFGAIFASVRAHRSEAIDLALTLRL